FANRLIWAHHRDRMSEHKITTSEFDAEGLTKIIIGALPEIHAKTLSLLGRRPKRIPRTERETIVDGCRRAFNELFLKVQELQTIDPAREPARAGVILEELLANLIRIGGIRRRRGEDILEFLTRFALKQTRPPRHPWTKRAEYTDTRDALWTFI